MNKLERELHKNIKKYERIAINDSVDAIKRAHDSSLMVMGCFEGVTPDRAFQAAYETSSLIGSIQHQAIHTLSEWREKQEIEEPGGMQKLIDAQQLAAELVWFTKDSIERADAFVLALLGDKTIHIS